MDKGNFGLFKTLMVHLYFRDGYHNTSGRFCNRAVTRSIFEVHQDGSVGKALATKPDYLNSSSRTHVAKRGNELLRIVLLLPHGSCGMHTK